MPMGLVCSSLGAVAVAGIYLVYGAYRDHLLYRLRREGLRRQRVAYLLWNVANRFGTEGGELTYSSSDVSGGYLGDHRFRLL
jgi:hypothetical protein